MNLHIKQMLAFLVVILMLCTTSIAQSISGKVTDNSSGKPVVAASLVVKSTRAGTATDVDGNFSINAKANDILTVSASGYATQEVKITGLEALDIQLQPQTTNLDQIVILGSRSGGRVRTESPVPVDVINMNDALQTTARPDLTSMLNYAAPSFNYNKQSGSDGADQIDLATLRGLGPDQTLVLVNGKRRHQTAFVAVFGTRGRGNSGTDLNAIPEAAIDRVEILRDGASAQYGSDAMAGVINLVLKKNTDEWQINTGVSAYYDTKFNPHFGGGLKQQYEYGDALDGKAFDVSINKGFKLGRSGFINLSGNYFAQEKTFRQVLDTNLANKNALPINTGRRANGDGSVERGGVIFNMEIPAGNSATRFYAFGGLNSKSSDAFAYTRTFHGFNPLSSSRPGRFPTTPNGKLIWTPAIMKSVPSPNDLPDTIYNPHIQTEIRDQSIALGFKGRVNDKWDWDISNTLGRNDFHYYGDQTFNASLGATKTRFDNGGFNFLQNTSNLDVNRDFPSVAQGLALSAGLEFRFEQYKIYQGEKDSYFNYDPLNDKAAGSQGFPGFQPVDEVNASRTNQGFYVQSDLDATNAWLLSAAVRLENYSDFGFLGTYKFATRYKVSPKVNIRGSVSTGYRAPSLQQINFSNTFTNVQGGNSFDVKIAPNYSPITKAAGIPSLKEETSVNASLGFTAKPIKAFTITIDGYIVKIKDRVVLSGQFDNSNIALQPILDRLKVAQAQFFANAVNTTNTGLDIILNYAKKWNTQSINITFAGNFQNMKIDKVNVPDALNKSFEERQAFFSEREQRFVLASAPPSKLNLTLDYGVNKKLKLGTHVTYFGKISLLGYGYANTYPPLVELDADPNITVSEEFNYRGKLVTDVFASYKLCKAASLFIGADNLFNVHPDLGYVNGAKLSAYDGETGGPWDAVQMGSNGLRLFVKARFNF